MKKISKILLDIVLGVTMLLSSFLAVAQNPNKVVMNFTQNPTREMAFNWFTTSNTTGEQVQIAIGTVSNPNSFTPFKTVNATTTNQTIHKAVVTGLSPNTKYSFRVGKAGFWSKIGTFTTAKAGKESFSFMYITDTQVEPNTYNFNRWESNVQAAFAQCPNVNFLLHCGDFARDYIPGDWERIFGGLQDYFYNYPFAPTRGNHDNPVDIFNKHFNLNAASFDPHGSTYTFIYGDAQFFAINSELWNGNIPDDAYISNLSAWMTTHVNAHPGVKWRIVYYHKIIYSGFEGIQNETKCQAWHNAITPLFDALNIDIAFQGHTHMYEVIGPVKNKKLVPEAVEDVLQENSLINYPKNVNGKSGGTFNVRKGTLYFTNGIFGDSWEAPVTSTQQLNGTYGIQDYASLVTGRLGSFCGLTSTNTRFCETTGTTSSFSNVSVSSDSIIISTYTAVNGVSTLFDKIKVVKHCISPAAITINGATPWNTPKSIGDVTIPSNATLTITANITASDCSVITIENGGKLIINGGTIDGATIVAKSGSTCTIQNNGKILLEKFDDFDVQLGAVLNLDYGEVLVK